MRHGIVLGPAVAGSWYPRGRDVLAGLVDELLDGAVARAVAAAPERVTALIAPHAGFAYSGAVAASAFLTLRGKAFDRIVLLGPSHYFGFHGAAVPDAATAYRTPLGDLPIDREAVDVLRGSAGFRADDAMFEPEHALESELPFLQRVLGSATSITPILLGGRATFDDAQRVAAAIERLVAASTLVVVSSDFTHFGARFEYTPFSDDVPARLRALDLGAVEAIASGDAAAFARYVDETGATICGRRAIEVLLLLSSAAAGARLLEYDTSGRITGTWDHSVSYAAIAVDAAGAVSA
jgi:AmmeMemoRadiSam system protein B